MGYVMGYVMGYGGYSDTNDMVNLELSKTMETPNCVEWLDN